jgi:hypothetical protein
MKQLIEGTDFYYNEQDLMVLTAKYLLERGYCCGNGCKHCPFNYERVSEPRRSQLILQQQEHGNSEKDK